MADIDSTYRTPRRSAAMDPNSKRLALIAGGIAGVLALVVGAWSFTGGKSAGVPVVEADARPVRVKPEKSTGPQVDDPVDTGTTALAPTPEAPAPQALRAQAAAATAAAATAASVKPPSEPVALTSPTQPAPPVGALAAAAPPVPQSTAPQRPLAATVPAAIAPTARAIAPAASAPAASIPAATGPQAQLAALLTEQAALAEWQRLEKRMPDVLSGRKPAVSKTERDGRIFWRLRTGGFADTGQVNSFCDRVRAKGGTCSVASY